MRFSSQTDLLQSHRRPKPKRRPSKSNGHRLVSMLLPLKWSVYVAVFLISANSFLDKMREPLGHSHRQSHCPTQLLLKERSLKIWSGVHKHLCTNSCTKLKTYLTSDLLSITEFLHLAHECRFIRFLQFLTVFLKLLIIYVCVGDACSCMYGCKGTCLCLCVEIIK